MRDVTPIEALDAKLMAIYAARTLLRQPDIGADPFYDDKGRANVVHLPLNSLPVAWSESCLSAVESASTSFPIETWPPPPHSDTGLKLHVFPRPLSVTSISFGEASVDIHALIIGIGIVQATGDVSLILWGYTKSSGRIVPSNALVPCFKYSCPIGQPFDRETIDREWPMERAALLKLAFAVSSFLDQRITTEERAHVERQARRRAERLDVEPVVHVVRFRKSEARTHNGDNSHDVEWSCQWLVRGHWRNQWHPRLQRHAPVWILPHIKGPADMPLKTPAPEVWQVAR